MALNVAAVQKFAWPEIKATMDKECLKDSLPYMDSWDFDVSCQDLPYCCTNYEMPSTTNRTVIALTICYALQNQVYALQCNTTNRVCMRVLKFFGFEEKYKYLGGHGAVVHNMVLLLRGYKL